ncbi:MAG: hypothetical protein HQ546_01520 [Planctomycetes bacterium]|nr:hypothetical protein [Planctomycetota bacterium]
MADVKVLCEISPEAQIHPQCRIGRWCVIGPGVRIGEGTKLSSRVTVMGQTIIGTDNVIDTGSVLGGEPQDLKYRGGNTYLLIGDRNRIGHNVTINVGTECGGWVTYLGSDIVLGDACHVAHDCYIADGARLGPKVLLAGHIVVQRGAVIESMTGVHHFARIGRYARVGPRTPVRRDIPPFVNYYSNNYYCDTPMIRGLHEAGIAAAGLGDQDEAELRKALSALFENESAMKTKLEQLQRRGPLSPDVEDLCRFCRESLLGRFGRYREQFRDQIPPEAEQYLPADLLRTIRGQI